jgi:hypothetical protein
VSYSQEVYDAARSRISNGDVGAAIERVAYEALDISHAKAMLQELIAAVGYEMMRPSVLYRPAISLDGDHYCALYGEDLMSGCAGFGRTMAEAMTDFDQNWWKQQAPRPVRAA